MTVKRIALAVGTLATLLLTACGGARSTTPADRPIPRGDPRRLARCDPGARDRRHGPVDAQAVYDEYAAQLVESGWVLTDGSTALIGTYELDGNTLTLVVTSDTEQRRLRVSVVPSWPETGERRCGDDRRFGGPHPGAAHPVTAEMPRTN